MVKSMDLSGAEYLIAILAAFYLGRSYIMLALSFRSALGCRGQNHHRLYPQAIWTFIVCPWQCLSLTRVLGPNVKWAGVINSLAPQQPLKILLSNPLVREEGFGDVGPISRLAQFCPSSMSVSLYLPGKCPQLSDIPLVLLTSRSYCFNARGASLISFLYEATIIQRLKMALGVEWDLSRLQLFLEICTN